jgi:predicted membrane protein
MVIFAVAHQIKTGFNREKPFIRRFFCPAKRKTSLPLPQKKVNMNTQKKSHSWLVGIIFVLLGGALIARNTGLIPHTLHGIIVSWQMLLIVLGIGSIVKRRTFHFHGLVLIFAGIFFIVPKLVRVFPSMFGGINADSFVSVYWPVLLIVGGLTLILHIPVHHRRCHTYRRSERCYQRFGRNDSPNDTSAQNEGDCSREGNFSKTCIFGSGNYIVIDTEFKGGTLQAIFGGIELDLRKAHLPEGETCLNIEAIFGGISLFVPDNWSIEVNIESVLGGADDNRRIIEAVDDTRKLIITGSAVFGGVEIRN